MLPQLIAQRARESANRVYLESVDGGSMTYAQVHESATRWAGAYRRAGVQQGARIVTMLPLGPDFYCSAIGMAWIRAVEVPLNTDYRGALLVHALRLAEPALVVAHADFVDQLLDVADKRESLPPLIVIGEYRPRRRQVWATVSAEEFLKDANPIEACAGPNVWDVASIMFTSGTTGPSKGVVMPWGQLQKVALRGRRQFASDDCYYLAATTYHLSAKGAAFAMAQVNGRVVLRDRFSATRFFEDIRRFRCTQTSLFGVAASILMADKPRVDDAESPLRQVMMAPVISDIDAFKTRFGVAVCTGYGMTEIGPAIAAEADEVDNSTYRSCGRVMPGYQARIVDEHDNELPAGATGELIVRSDEVWTLNLGYLGMAAESVQAWRNGWFHTGDAFRSDRDGLFYFVDRLKDSIRRRGENISSFDVESLVNRHREVAESAAVAVPSELGEDDVKIFVVRKPSSALSESQLIADLVPETPRFMLPRYVEFIDALPKTPTNRIRKRELRELGVSARTWDRQASQVLPPANTRAMT